MMGFMDDNTGWGITISCDECSMQCTSACDDCVVTFVLRADEQFEGHGTHDGLALDLDQVRVVRLLGKAGLVPELKYEAAS